MSTVLLQIEEGIARITLNRPERRNAMDAEMVRDFPAVVEG